MIVREHGTNAKYTREGCRCAECVAARAAYIGNWRAKNPARESMYQAKKRERRNPVDQAVRRRELYYGLDDAGYQALRTAQDNRCAICQSSFEERQPHVDHDHKCCPGKRSCGQCVRGLLCRYCNTALGKFNDDPALLMRAIEYLTAAEISAISTYFTARNP